MGEVTDERVDLAEREGGRRVPLEVAPDEAVVGDLQLQRGGAGVLDRRGAVLFDQPEDTQDTADPELAVSAMDRGAELPMWVPARVACASSVSVVGGVRVGRSAGWIAWRPGAWRRCSRSSAPVVGWSRRTCTPSHWTAMSRPSQPGGGA